MVQEPEAVEKKKPMQIPLKALQRAAQNAFVLHEDVSYTSAEVMKGFEVMT
jgi:hypothetical protein